MTRLSERDGELFLAEPHIAALSVSAGSGRSPRRHGHTTASSPDPRRPKDAYVREDQIVPRLPALHLLLTGSAAERGGGAPGPDCGGAGRRGWAGARQPEGLQVDGGARRGAATSAAGSTLSRDLPPPRGHGIQRVPVLTFARINYTRALRPRD